MKYIRRDCEFKNISAIPINTEQCISFDVDRFRFLHSLQFLQPSLDSLVENIKTDDCKNFRNVPKHFKNDIDKIDVLTCKGVYPCNFVDNFSEFGTPLEDLTIDDFYDKLNDKAIDTPCPSARSPASAHSPATLPAPSCPAPRVASAPPRV
jgi:hypothetical protein